MSEELHQHRERLINLNLQLDQWFHPIWDKKIQSSIQEIEVQVKVIIHLSDQHMEYKWKKDSLLRSKNRDKKQLLPDWQEARWIGNHPMIEI